MSDSEKFFQNLVENVHEGLYLLDPERRITYWNKGAERISGFTAGEIVGSCCADGYLMHIDERGVQLCKNECPVSMTLRDGQPREADVYLHHKDGHRVPVRVRVGPIFDSQGGIVGAVETFDDNSARLAATLRKEHLESASMLDPLTGLGNRRFIEMSLHARFAEKQRFDRNFGVLFIDVDHLSEANQRHGREIGDRLLKMVAATLSGVSRGYDVVGRWGGEEFVIVSVAGTEDLLHMIADRTRIFVKESSLLIGTQQIRLTVSIGVTPAQVEDTPETVIARAEALMKESKDAGRDRVTMDIIA
jgi:diguanylate cyclase (GGDEF)-like protein/PAS domain S-box-containing protein